MECSNFRKRSADFTRLPAADFHAHINAGFTGNGAEANRPTLVFKGFSSGRRRKDFEIDDDDEVHPRTVHFHDSSKWNNSEGDPQCKAMSNELSNVQSREFENDRGIGSISHGMAGSGLSIETYSSLARKEDFDADHRNQLPASPEFPSPPTPLTPMSPLTPMTPLTPWTPNTVIKPFVTSLTSNDDLLEAFHPAGVLCVTPSYMTSLTHTTSTSTSEASFLTPAFSPASIVSTATIENDAKMPVLPVAVHQRRR